MSLTHTYTHTHTHTLKSFDRRPKAPYSDMVRHPVPWTMMMHQGGSRPKMACHLPHGDGVKEWHRYEPQGQATTQETSQQNNGLAPTAAEEDDEDEEATQHDRDHGSTGNAEEIKYMSP
jgi:hypothetical protein